MTDRPATHFVAAIQSITLTIMLAICTACSLTPNPKFVDYSRLQEQNGTATGEPTILADGNDIDRRSATMAGDRGVYGADATSSSARELGTYSLGMSSLVWQLANQLLPYLKTPYLFGGESEQGIDCSGLTMMVYKNGFNIDLPHKAALQYKMGRSVSRRELLAGDLVFFYEQRGRNIGHVGIYIDDDQFIHSMSGKGVVISDLTTGYWKKYFAGARRMLLRE